MIGTRGTTGPADLTDVRATNLAVVLRFVRAHAPCSRADIAASTGLNKATVSSLVADLLERGLLREAGMAGNRIGRPAAMLTLHSEPYASIGVEVTADRLAVVAIDLTGERLLSWKRAFPGLTGPAGRAEAAVAALAGRVTARMAAEGRRVLGLTVAVPGTVDDSGTVRFAGHLGRPDLRLRAALTRSLRRPDFPVEVGNDADLAALAEFRGGEHAGTADLVTLIGGAEIGAGVIAGGHPVRGARGLAGRIGHLPAGAGDAACRCGRSGCLESVAGLPALIARALPGSDADGPVTDHAPELERIVLQARAGDPVTAGALDEAGRALGHAVSILADVLDPRVVVLGGAYATLFPWLRPAAQAELDSRTADGPLIARSTLEPGAAAAGAAMLTLDRLEAGVLPAPL